MATAAGGNRALVEMKAVDGLYPLYGKIALDPDMTKRFVRCTHRRRRIAVDLQDLVASGNAAACAPQRAGRICCVFDVLVEHR